VVIATQTMLAMRCPECGRLEYHNLSRFTFPAGRPLQIRCPCGVLKAVVRKKGDYFLQVRCAVCERMHPFRFGRRLFWAPEVTFLFCPDTDCALGELGPLAGVKTLTLSQKKEINSLFNELAGEDYFHRREAMKRVLARLSDLCAEGLLFCQCGNYKIGVEIFPDRLELRCARCGGVSVVYAETEEDVAAALQIDKLELVQDGMMNYVSRRNP